MADAVAPGGNVGIDSPVGGALAITVVCRVGMDAVVAAGAAAVAVCGREHIKANVARAYSVGVLRDGRIDPHATVALAKTSVDRGSDDARPASTVDARTVRRRGRLDAAVDAAACRHAIQSRVRHDASAEALVRAAIGNYSTRDPDAVDCLDIARVHDGKVLKIPNTQARHAHDRYARHAPAHRTAPGENAGVETTTAEG